MRGAPIITAPSIQRDGVVPCLKGLGYSRGRLYFTSGSISGFIHTGAVMFVHNRRKKKKRGRRRKRKEFLVSQHTRVCISVSVLVQEHRACVRVCRWPGPLSALRVLWQREIAALS